ncbi:metallophosphoesterase family protein [Loktanella sp. M215]|uniref:metallophosphoesterase family protein n=1 Tax=Loktanella sp. M215 TaxID=2675431 RepID=UPI001F45207D
MTRHRIALIADPHFHDSTGDFGQTGVMIAGQRHALLNWEKTRTASRAVNESAMALRAALDRIAARGIRIVVIAGDYSDEGQIENLQRLADLLHDAETRLGLRIHVLPGNHDCYAVGGKHRAIRYATGPRTSELVTSDPALDADVLSPAMFCPGLPEALMPMARFGLRRRADDLHWETPFGTSDRFEDRTFVATAPDGVTTHQMIDASYLVEPEPGLWLLMLDANVFEPRVGIRDPRRKRAFRDPTDAGWDAVLRVKPFLLDWIACVTRRATQAGKLLIPVSHYPILPHWSGLDPVLPRSALARRAPSPEVAAKLADAGLRLHFGGHLHINATTTTGGITDVSLPATCAFPAAFAVLDGDARGVAMTQVSLGDLPPDPVASVLYAAEGAPLSASHFGSEIASRHRARALSRRLAHDLPDGLWPALSDLRVTDLPRLIGVGRADLPDVPLADMMCDLLMLIDGGALALPYISADRLDDWRRIATLRGTSTDPLGRWVVTCLELLAMKLDRVARQQTIQPLQP